MISRAPIILAALAGAALIYASLLNFGHGVLDPVPFFFGEGAQ